MELQFSSWFVVQISHITFSSTCVLINLESGGPPIAESTPLDKNKAARRGGAADSIRMSMSETSLTDEIMMALRDR